MRLEHVTLRTANVGATRDFLLEVFDDLKDGPRPKQIDQRIPGHWLFAAHEPIIHIIAGSGYAPSPTPGAIDHVGLKLADYAGFRSKLDRLNVPYSLMDLSEISERRIFFRTPEGVLLETIFDEPTTAHNRNR